MINSIARLPAVLTARGTSRSSHYTDIQQGLWTKPVMISDRSVGWPTYEVEAINAARIAGMTKDEIRKLVADLEAQRKTRLDALRGEHQDRQSISEEEAASDD